MSAGDCDAVAARKREAARRLVIAEDDRRVASLCLRATPPSLEIAAYHCQQSSEKLIKGMLIVAGVHFPKTHDLRALGSIAEEHFPACQKLYLKAIPLTGWGHAYRYPGMEDEPPPTPEELADVLKLIDELTKALRGLIAPAA